MLIQYNLGWDGSRLVSNVMFHLNIGPDTYFDRKVEIQFIPIYYLLNEKRKEQKREKKK